MSDPNASARISPTAHYTGYVWYRNGLSDSAFRTRAGALLYQALRPWNRLSRARGGPHLEAMLLARHRMLDHVLAEAIGAGEIGQVVEVAAGLSPRGVRFVRGHDALVYVEADLPGMCAEKRRVLAAAGFASPRHHVVEVDALADDGPRSLAGACAPLLDDRVGTALITEGLISYFPKPAVVGMWRRFAAFLGRYPRGRYLSNLQARDEMEKIRGVRVFSAALSLFARGQVHSHYANAAAAEEALEAAGFVGARFYQIDDLAAAIVAREPDARVPSTRESAQVYVFEARTA